MKQPAVAEQYAEIKVSPRVKLAAQLYASGAVKSKLEASKVAGVTNVHFTNMTNHNPEVRRIIGQVQTLIEDESISNSVIISKLSRQALGRLAELMNSPSDAIAFRAAQDLADRGNDTSKTQKLQVEALSLNGEDARAIAAAMVESANANRSYAHIAKDGLIEVDTDRRVTHPQLALHQGGEPPGG